MELKKLNIKYFLIIIIIISIGYLLYTNYIENKTIESFGMRNSLSSYFQSTDDSTYNSLTHEYNNNKSEIKFEKSVWNGTYSFNDVNNKLNYITFLQINKTILFVMNLANYSISGEEDPYVYSEDNTNKECLPGTLIGRGQLNLEENLFYLKNIYCSNNNSGTGAFNPFGEEITEDTINLLYAFYDADQDTITITQNKENDNTAILYQVQLTKDKNFKYGPSAEYLLRTSYNIPAPNVHNSIRINPDVCYNSTFGSNKQKGSLKNCYITTDGLPTPNNQENDEYKYNPYGTGCALKDEIIDEEYGESTYKACPKTNSTCFIPIKNNDGQQITSVGGYPQCTTNFDLNYKNQSSIMYPYYLKEQTNGNLLDVCNYLDGFQTGKYNASILMYIDELSDVQSLNYDFFGIEKGENYLTTKTDIMFPYMNKYFLKNLRNSIQNSANSTNTSDLEKALQLTNCIQEYNTTNNFNNILTTCASNYSSDIQQKFTNVKNNIMSNLTPRDKKEFLDMENIIDNIDSAANENRASNLLQPTVWQLEFLKNENTDTTVSSYTNDCSFILSSSNKYNKESRFVKYAEFDSVRNKTNINLYKGGIKQKLVMENPYIISSLEEIMGNSYSPDNTDNISNDFIMVSGNLRTYNPKKYVLPGQASNVSTFGNQLYMNNTPNPNGKWVLLGFNLTKDLDIGTSPNSYNKTLIKTLKKISQTLN